MSGRLSRGPSRAGDGDIDRVTRWYYRSDRLTNAALRVLRGTFDGLWLGLLSPDGFARIDKVYYDRAGTYVTESYNRRGLWPWEQSAVDRHFHAARKIIVTSASGGREVLALAKAGFDVIGYEPHEDLVRFGNDLLATDGTEAVIRLSERDRWPTDADDADAAIVGWGGYMLIAGRGRRVAFLRAAAGRLPRGAPVLLSFFPRDGDDTRMRSTKRVADPLRRLLGRDPIAVGDALVPNLVHYFTRQEIAAEMADAGFELIDFGSDEYGWAVGRAVAGQAAST